MPLMKMLLRVYNLVMELYLGYNEEKNPGVAPKGFVPIQVGEERRRYFIPVSYLSSISLKAFLHQFEEEIQANMNGPITLPCSFESFEAILALTMAEKTGSL